MKALLWMWGCAGPVVDDVVDEVVDPDPEAEFVPAEAFDTLVVDTGDEVTLDLAICDLDGDGQDDLARLVRLQSGTEVQIYQGPIHDPGALSSPVSRLGTQSVSMTEVACGHWGGESTYDLVVATENEAGADLGLFLDPGVSDVEELDLRMVLSAGYVGVLQLRDLDGDGLDEMLFCEVGGSGEPESIVDLSAWREDADRPLVRLPGADTCLHRFIDDVSGDGNAELLVYQETGDKRIYDSSFVADLLAGQTPTPWAVLPNYTAFDAATRDDGDAVALSLLDGLFTGTSSELQANTPIEQLAPLSSLDDQPIVLSLHSADLTGDGVDDVVLEQLPGGGGHTLAILDGAALGDVLYQQEASEGIARATEIGDLDGDGREDVVTHFVDDDRSSILYLLSSGL